MFNKFLDLLGVPGPQTQVPGLIADADLERMLFAAMQSKDTARADRIRAIQAMRRPPEEPLLTEAMQSVDQQRTRSQNIGGKLNPFNPLNDVLGQQQ